MREYVILLVGLVIGFVLGFLIPVISEKLKNKEKRSLFEVEPPDFTNEHYIKFIKDNLASDVELHGGTFSDKPMSPRILSDIMKRITNDDVIISDSKDIEYEVYDGPLGGCFICLAKDEECEHLAECTNHDSAGDIRSLHSLLPDIYFLDEENSICRCLVAEGKALPKFGSMLLLEEVKENLVK